MWSARLLSFYLFRKVVCFQVCCSSSFSFPEVQWRKNSNWGQVSQWQAVTTDLFPMQYVGPAAAFPGWNIMPNSDTFCINESCVSTCTSRSSSGGMYNRGYLYRTVRGVIWSGKKWRANNTRRRTEQVSKMPRHSAVTLQLVPPWESHQAGANDDDYRSTTRGRLFLEAALFYLEKHCRQAARSFFLMSLICSFTQ